MTNIEVAEANTLRLKARIAVRGLPLSPSDKKAVISAIDDVELPLHKYYKVNKEDTVKAFIRKVLANIGDEIQEKERGEIEKCLQTTL